jgi:hypothetical protein
MSAHRLPIDGCICLCLILLVAVAASAIATTAGIEEEYDRRARNVAPDDVDGHLKLAQWCKEKKAWALLRDECVHILRLKPDHVQAKLLLQLAKANLRKGGEPGTTGDPEPQPDAGSNDFVRIITDDEVQILRRAELFRSRPERVTVKFLNDVLKRYAEERFGPDRMSKANFMRLQLAEKAQVILGDPARADRFASDILITSDPWLFREFERNVLPIITEGCASAQCHGGPNAGNFRLITGRRLTTNKVYTNFMILNNYKGDPPQTMKLLNRDARGFSLVLFWGEANAAFSEYSPPPHPVDIEPIYRSPNDPKFRRVLAWVQSLSTVAPDYGIDIRPRKR